MLSIVNVAGPAGRDIYVDGVYGEEDRYGTAPCTIDTLGPGPHKFESLRQVGGQWFVDFRIRAEVVAGATIAVTLSAVMPLEPVDRG